MKPGIEKRLEASVATAMQMANGLVQVAIVGGEEQLYSSSWPARIAASDVPALEPRSFSFNSIYGACPECNGLGSKYDFDPAKIIVDWSKPLLDGALGPGSGSQYLQRMLHIAARSDTRFDLTTPFEKLPRKRRTSCSTARARKKRRALASTASSPICEQNHGRVDVGGYRDGCWTTCPPPTAPPAMASACGRRGSR